MKAILKPCAEFYFSRHGQTDNNVSGLVTGAVDVPLNQSGIVQAIAAAEFIQKLPIDSCVCSPLQRASLTAELMIAKTSLTPTPLEGLEERNWGKLENTPKDELDRYSFSEMGVEMWEDYIERTKAAFAKLDLSKTLLIVAHSGTFRVLCDSLHINIKKQPVRNAWPYRFYQTDGEWLVEECGL